MLLPVILRADLAAVHFTPTPDVSSQRITD